MCIYIYIWFAWALGATRLAVAHPPREPRPRLSPLECTASFSTKTFCMCMCTVLLVLATLLRPGICRPGLESRSCFMRGENPRTEMQGPSRKPDPGTSERLSRARNRSREVGRTGRWAKKTRTLEVNVGRCTLSSAWVCGFAPSSPEPVIAGCDVVIRAHGSTRLSMCFRWVSAALREVRGKGVISSQPHPTRITSVHIARVIVRGSLAKTWDKTQRAKRVIPTPVRPSPRFCSSRLDPRLSSGKGVQVKNLKNMVFKICVCRVSTTMWSKPICRGCSLCQGITHT